ncbi:MAG: DNA polymerase III [Spirochaetaceae bacterium]|jgi:DNA polymerase-3 subunit gamma/tau|nr:DNA polymerase III [Spirochaetaceae bacterium]
MFENVLGQPAVTQLSADITGGTLAPSMLFSGPPASGKGTAGLELARILSCENPGGSAPWNCSCAACSRHRNLTHPDLILLGSRPFSVEASAASAVFSRESGSPSARMFFIRSVRKLLARFVPAVWEDEPKLGKLNGFILALEEDLDELEALTAEPAEAAARRGELEKIGASILKNVFKLEAEGVGEFIPAAQVRRAAYWSRLAPLGKRKFLLIENADSMKEEARNSLLKILEEPPPAVTILLTSAHRDALLPTILSRLRPYRFIRRDRATEAEVIRRVFKDTVPEAGVPAAGREQGAGISGETEGMIVRYLDAFLPVSGETLRPAAAFFAASAAAGAAILLKNRGTAPPEELTALGRYTAPMAEAAGYGRPARDMKETLGKVLQGAEQFTVRSLFPRFLRILLSLAAEGLPPGPGRIAFLELWRRHIGRAEIAVGTYNQNPALTLDRLGTELKRAMAGLEDPRI